MEEVLELTVEKRRGNDAARHIWLANAPPLGGKYPGGQRPKEGERIEVFKQFVVDCYEYGKFRATTPFIPEEASLESTHVSATKPLAKPPTSSAIAPPREGHHHHHHHSPGANSSLRKVSSGGKSLYHAEVDLLNFDAFGDNTPAPAPLLSSTFEFDAFGQTRGHTQPPPAVVMNSSFDLFGGAFGSTPQIQPTAAYNIINIISIVQQQIIMLQ